jgi:RHS repeat-associated protein
MADSASGQTCKGLSWTYDAWGDLTNQNNTNGTCYTFQATVGTNNQLGSPYRYDAAGNMTYDGTNTYYYDAEDRLIQVNGTLGTCSSATACYTYDALGKRVEKVAGSAITQYLYSANGQIILETDGSGNGNPTADYMYLGGSFVAEYKNSTTYFPVSDHLGSSRILTGMNQSVVQILDYYPFGQLNSSDSGYTTHKFTGDERDAETGLDHTDFRQYASPQGRWISPDPAGLAAVDPTNPQSWNRYAYVLGDPLSLVDPLGLDCYPVTFPDGSLGFRCDVPEPGGDGPGVGGIGLAGVGTTNPCPLSVSLYDGDFYGIADAMDDGGANRIGGVPELSAQNGNCRIAGGGGGSGNTSGGFFSRLGNRLACAAEFGDAHSLAAATGTENSFLGKAFLGNTFSGITQLGLLATGGPSGATATDVGIAMLSGTHQGLPGGGNIGKGPLGVAQDAAIAGAATAGYNAVVGAGTQTLELGVNASGKVATAISGLSETAAGTVAGVIGAVKLVGDFSTFAYGGIFKCK